MTSCIRCIVKVYYLPVPILALELVTGLHEMKTPFVNGYELTVNVFPEVNMLEHIVEPT